jgi:hypothetical protein
MQRNETPTPQKKRRPCEKITFEKHYGEPLTEQEQDELADLIASIIFDSLLQSTNDKPVPTT